MKKLITVVLVSLIVLLLTGSSFALQIADKPSVNIDMNEDGFEPAEVFISQSHWVAFVNSDKIDRWPASDIHPTHEIYPEFDPQKPIKPGESWQSRFDSSGTFKYHDHLLPHKRGVIHVKSQPLTFNKKIRNFLYSIKTFFLNLFPKRNNALGVNRTNNESDNLKNLVEGEGIESAWQYLVKNYSNNNSPNAHDLAHFLGGLIYNRKGLDGISTCDGSFAFGCFHGFAEKAFSKDLSKLPSLEKACEKLGVINSGPYASCIHGFGHGIATYFNTSDLQGALISCDKLSNGQNFCYDGVFMEFATNASVSFYTKNLNPLFPCNSLEDKYHQSCARNLPIVMSKYKNMDLPSIVQVCSESDNKTIKYFCIDAIGLQAGQRWAGNIDNITSYCDLTLTDENKAQCYSAAAGELVFQNYPLWQEAAPTLCNRLSKQFRQGCFLRYQQVAKDYDRSF